MEGGRLLTDHRGCGLGEVATRWSPTSGVRQLSAGLEVPQVEGRMVVQCRVVACRGPCPTQACRGEGEVSHQEEVGGLLLEVEARVGRSKQREPQYGYSQGGFLDKLQVGT